MDPSLADPVALGARYRTRGKLSRAEPLLRTAVAGAEAAEPRDDARLGAALNALGLLCKDLAKYDEGRACYERALWLLLGAPATHPDDVATLYHNLGGIEHARGDYAAGEAFARRGLAIRRTAGAGGRHALAADLAALAALVDGQGRSDEAEALYAEALDLFERAPHPDATEIAVVLNGLGALYVRRGQLERAAALLERAAAAKRRALGPRHPDLAVTLNNLALTYKRRGDLARARACYADALAILDAALGAAHPKTIACRENADRCVVAARERGDE